MEERALTWEITGADESRRLRRALGPVLGVAALAALIIVFVPQDEQTWDRSGIKGRAIGLACVGTPILVALALMFRRALFPDIQARRYVLDASGLTVRKGNRTAAYPWSDFVSYAADECQGPLKGLGRETGSHPDPLGRSVCFYLLKRRGSLRRTFLVVEPGQDNRDEVGAMLGAHLPGAKMLHGGFLRYVEI